MPYAVELTVTSFFERLAISIFTDFASQWVKCRRSKTQWTFRNNTQGAEADAGKPRRRCGRGRARTIRTQMEG